SLGDGQTFAPELLYSTCERLRVDALGFFDHAFEVEARARRLRRASAEGEPTPFIFKQRGDGCGQRVGVGDWYYRACESVLDYLARALGRRRNDGHAAGQRLGHRHAEGFRARGRDENVERREEARRVVPSSRQTHAARQTEFDDEPFDARAVLAAARRVLARD